MAETLSYQEPQNVTTVDNLTAEEQDSLAVGEKLVEQQDQLYAGKYKDAQELEKAYMELQKKLGEPKEEAETASAEKEEPEKPKLSEGATLITSAQDEYYKNGNKLSDETLAKFSSMSSSDLLQAYMEINADNPQQAEPVASEITPAQVSDIKSAAGGEQQYANVVNWAKSNLDGKAINAFDEVVNTGSVEAIKLAVSGLKAQYDNANGVEGRMVTGKAPTQSGDIFRSQAELVAAMNDPRYDRDPAYRQDVIDKLDRSNLEF
jgi:hypothetical protein|tara:strand:- start:336 stop:1124 length:789 start_codon:yes stop_codon:yes gene_type:complete